MSQPPNQPYPGQPNPEQPGSGSPWSGQPASGQPNSSPPYPGQPGQPSQPYPGQPYPGQPYPGQPYQGQPNPDVPTSVPPQPGYPPQPAYVQQPSYPQPEYAQPDYTQAYPQSGPPMGGYPVPPKNKSRALPITLVSIAVVLVLCLGGGTAIYLVGRNTADNRAEEVQSATPSPRLTGNAEPTEDATTEPPASTITVVEPKTLGGRPKLTDAQFAGAAEELEQGLAAVPDATETVGALYGTPEKQDIVIVAAAAAPIEDPKRELDATFLGAGVGGLKLTGITNADAGALGGVAKCGKGDAGGAPLIMCGWADEGSVGWVIWYFKSMSKAKAEFSKLRAQVEKKSN
jgi:hypothetical protein